MLKQELLKQQIEWNGFAVIPDVFNATETAAIIEEINRVDAVTCFQPHH